MSSSENDIHRYLYKPLSFASKDHLRMYVKRIVELFDKWKVPFYLITSLMKDSNNTDFELYFQNESLIEWIKNLLTAIDKSEAIQVTLFNMVGGDASKIGPVCYLIILYLMIEMKKYHCSNTNHQNDETTTRFNSLIGYFVGAYMNDDKIIEIASFQSRECMKELVNKEKGNHSIVLLDKSIQTSLGGCVNFVNMDSAIDKDQCNLSCMVETTTRNVLFRVGERVIIADGDKSDNFVITSANNARQLILSYRVNSLYQRVWVLITNYSPKTPSKTNDYFGYIIETPKFIHVVTYDAKQPAASKKEELPKELRDDRSLFTKVGSLVWSNWKQKVISAQFYMFGLDRV